MSKILRSLMVAMFLCVSVVVGVSSPAAARSTTLEVLNIRPIPGEMTTFVGRTSTNFKSRKLSLQYWRSSKSVA